MRTDSLPATLVSRSVAETRALGARVARQSQPGGIYALQGDLGCGKTEFVRGFVDELNPDAVITSPSFTLLNRYDTPAFPVYHFDFYRLSDPDELIETGFYEYAASGGVCLIEWADIFGVELDVPVTAVIGFTDIEPEVREITIGKGR